MTMRLASKARDKAELPAGYQFGHVPVHCEGCGRRTGWCRTGESVRVLSCSDDVNFPPPWNVIEGEAH